MRLNNTQLPRESHDHVKGIFGISYQELVANGDWTQYESTPHEQRVDGFDDSCCWNEAGIHLMETICNFYKTKGMFPKESLDWFTANGYFDANGSFLFSRCFPECLATYDNGDPVRDGGNDQIQCGKLAAQFGLLPYSDLEVPAGMSFVDQQDFDNYYFDKTKITQAMYDKAIKCLEYIDIQYQWIGNEGIMPSLQEINAAQLQSPLQLGLAASGEYWNSPTIVWNGSKEANHSVGLVKCILELPDETITTISDQYNIPIKELINYYIPMVSQIVVTPILQPPYIPPPTALPLPVTPSLWKQIWQAINQWYNRGSLLPA